MRSKFVNRRQIVGGFFGDERVDLDRQAEPSAMARRFHGALERSRHGADGVMLFGARAVEAQAQALNAMFLQLGDRVVGQFRRRARRDRNFQPQPVGIVDQLE